MSEEALQDIPTHFLFILATPYLLGLLFLIRECFTSEKQAPRPLKPWETNWPVFILFFTGVCWSVLTASLLADQAINKFFTTDPLDPSLTVLSGGVFHFVIIANILFWKKGFPEHFRFQFTEQSALPFRSVARGFFFFASALPLVGLLNFAWVAVLTYWVEQGATTINIEPQDVVQMLHETEGMLPLILMAVLAVVIAPISEELLFRGCIYRFLKGKVPPLVALTLSALLFALIHNHTASFIPLFLLGMLLGRSYEKTGNILVPIAFHSFFNLNSVVLLLILNSNSL